MNVSRLKDDINSGRTGDKVAAFDPAAAPLGTDEEAAGTPVSAAAVEMARASEMEPEGSERTRQDDAIAANGPRAGHRHGAGTWVLVLALVALLAFAVWFGVSGWQTAGDPDVGEVTGLGYGAMALGIIATLGLGIGLMVLIFRSERQ
ncbi:MAG: hypothetical protein FD144_3208 [Rhodospirillaceae bacterium]|nr:MAG: hypothetical protein FD144_3208 [Rhodospirillaceae bacterium]